MSRIVARFLGGDGERIFALLRKPAGRASGCALIVPPFAEEMNKSRKMMTDVGNELARRGIASVLVDPFGTGDSDGDFGAADWERWKADLRRAAEWCSSEGLRIDRLLGIRLGCALGAEVARDSLPDLEHTVFWQPVLDGARFLDQFLRLRVAASLMEHDRKETTAELRGRFAAGESVEVAGYNISPTLANQLDRVRLQSVLAPALGQIQWMEVVRSAEVPASVPALKAVEAAQARAVDISMHTIAGEPFWSSVEIIVNTTLVERSVAFLQAAARLSASS